MKKEINRLFRIIMVCLLITGMVLPMAGCRQSPALKTTSLHSQNEAEKVQDDFGRDEGDSSLDSGLQNEDTQVQQEIPDTIVDSDTNVEAVPDAELSIEGAKVAVAAETKSASGVSTAVATSGEMKAGMNGVAQKQEPTTEKETEPQTEPQTQQQPQEEPTEAEKPTKEMRSFYNDVTGEYIQLPTNVKRVAAVGAMAETAEMLKGDDCSIVATSSKLKTGLFASIFPDIMAADSIWKGDYATTLSDSAFEQLLSTTPDVVFCENNTFTAGQLETLSENQITPVYMSASSVSNTEYAQYLVGNRIYGISVLEDKTKLIGKVLGGEAVQKAASYCNYVDKITNTIKSKYNKDPVFEHQCEYVAGLGLWYESESAQNPEAIEVLPESDSVLFDAYSFLTSYWPKGMSYYSYESQYYSCIDTAGNYCILISGHIDQYQYYINASKYLSTQVTNYLGTDIETKHISVCVNPKGACSWVQNSPESILEAVWLTNLFYSDYNTCNINSELKNFYSTFFHYSLSEEQVAAILAGPES